MNRGGALALLVALAATTTIAVAAADSPNRAGVGNTAVTGSAPKVRRWVNPCARLNCLSTPRLERLARHVATHGGVTGTCKGCATPFMQRISLELVVRAFPHGSKAWAVCIVERESGANPGAISPSDDYGLGQIHAASWPMVNVRRQLRDPGYGARAFVLVSDHGRRRWPWNGGAYAC